MVSEHLGHADVAFTLRQYGHVIPGITAESTRRVAKKMFVGGLDGIL